MVNTFIILLLYIFWNINFQKFYLNIYLQYTHTHTHNKYFYQIFFFQFTDNSDFQILKSSDSDEYEL